MYFCLSFFRHTQKLPFPLFQSCSQVHAALRLGTSYSFPSPSAASPQFTHPSATLILEGPFPSTHCQLTTFFSFTLSLLLKPPQPGFCSHQPHPRSLNCSHEGYQELAKSHIRVSFQFLAQETNIAESVSH